MSCLNISRIITLNVLIRAKANVILFPSRKGSRMGTPDRVRERLGGLLNYYHRKAA